MSAEITSRPKFFGLLELDAAGTVLYSKIESAGSPGGAAHDITGRNFFSDVAPFKNVEKLHHRLDSFRQSSSQADSFEFNCDYEDGFVPVRVLVARIYGRSEIRATKSILIHIRKAHDTSAPASTCLAHHEKNVLGCG